MDALHALHTAQRHHQVFPELQNYWHELTLGVSPWDYLLTITLVLHPCQILFVPDAFSRLRNVTKLEIISKCVPAVACCSVPISCLHQLHLVKLSAVASKHKPRSELHCAQLSFQIHKLCMHPFCMVSECLLSATATAITSLMVTMYEASNDISMSFASSLCECLYSACSATILSAACHVWICSGRLLCLRCPPSRLLLCHVPVPGSASGRFAERQIPEEIEA